jgi:hypothetical protein
VSAWRLRLNPALLAYLTDRPPAHPRRGRRPERRSANGYTLRQSRWIEARTPCVTACGGCGLPGSVRTPHNQKPIRLWRVLRSSAQSTNAGPLTPSSLAFTLPAARRREIGSVAGSQQSPQQRRPSPVVPTKHGPSRSCRHRPGICFRLCRSCRCIEDVGCQTNAGCADPDFGTGNQFCGLGSRATAERAD